MKESRINGEMVVPLVVAMLIAGAFPTFFYEHAVHYSRISERVEEPYRFIEEKKIENAIVNIRRLPQAGWVFGIRNNHPDLASNDVILLHKAKAADLLRLNDAFPDRKLYQLFYKTHKDDRIDPVFTELSRDDLLGNK